MQPLRCKFFFIFIVIVQAKDQTIQYKKTMDDNFDIMTYLSISL